MAKSTNKKELAVLLNNIQNELSEDRESVSWTGDAQIRNLVKIWMNKRAEAKRFYKDDEMRKIDIEYSEKVKKLIIDKQIPVIDPVSPPLQIPLSVFSESKVGKKKKT